MNVGTATHAVVKRAITNPEHAPTRVRSLKSSIMCPTSFQFDNTLWRVGSDAIGQFGCMVTKGARKFGSGAEPRIPAPHCIELIIQAHA